MKDESVWVFAYGSLCWRPDFDYEEMIPGHIKGWVRTFWQGNTVHRGTAENPGRVATLTPTVNGVTYGSALRIRGSNAKKTLEYLDKREVKLGGYTKGTVAFYPSGSSTPHLCIVYIALPGNVDWRGPATLGDVAADIASASGVCGPNSYYITQLAAFLRAHDFEDEHVFQLEAILMDKIRRIRPKTNAPSVDSHTDSL